jgi:hypothetical protein
MDLHRYWLELLRPVIADLDARAKKRSAKAPKISCREKLVRGCA